MDRFIKTIGLGGTTVLLLFISACQSAALRPAEYQAWMQDTDHGLRIVREIAPYRVEAQYLPPAYMAARQGIEQYKQVKDSKELNFQLRISTLDRQQTVLRKDLQSPEEYQERVQYFSFELEDRLKLIAGPDTLSPVLYHFVRSYDVSPDLDCMLTFAAPTADLQSFRLLWDDDLLGMGPVHFLFHLPAREDIPNLIY